MKDLAGMIEFFVCDLRCIVVATLDVFASLFHPGQDLDFEIPVKS